MKIGHVDWLLNRIEELEMQLSINTNNMKQLQNKVEHYKQALEEIARGRFPGASYKARKALEGKK